MKMNRRTAIKITAAGVGSLALTPEFFAAKEAAQPFGAKFPQPPTRLVDHRRMVDEGRWRENPAQGQGA